MSEVKQNKLLVPFKELPYGTRFEYDERKHGSQTQVWVKIGRNLITNWNGYKHRDPNELWHFESDETPMDQLVFVVV